jgi:hypothetical protein
MEVAMSMLSPKWPLAVRFAEESYLETLGQPGPISICVMLSMVACRRPQQWLI